MIRCSIDGHIALLTLDNPPANTFTADGLAALKTTIGELNANAAVYAAVISGAGEKFFSGGADIKAFASGDKVEARRMAALFSTAFEALSDARFVTIAAINGYAMGGGLECALACDLRIAEEQAQMALPEASIGLLPCGLGTQTLPWLVGEGWAKRMILCNERLDAPRALQIGLIEEIAPRGAARERALALAHRVAALSPRAVASSKQLIHNARRGVARGPALALERERFVDLFDGADPREGVNAFLEKRKPRWTDA